ncbi:hypothetical protein [Marinobacter gudaonensis]|uniref:hypothetical protein n=1 Tax=Marinobacter gudaonensis TaxID=375760 RepID=UPI000B82DF25|nr:hypothetical protein [Marinobacter gudaonensis]
MINRWLINKIMDPLPIWLQVAIVLALLGAIAWVYAFAAKDAAFMFHNHTIRPIHDVNLSGNWLGGAAASNGKGRGVKGGSICCARIDSGGGELAWTFGVTQSQYDAGLRKQTEKIMVQIPERREGEFYLHVHIFSNDEVRLFWSNSTSSHY